MAVKPYFLSVKKGCEMDKDAFISNLQTNSSKEEGLYLIFPEGKFISITPQKIEEYFQAFLRDPSLFPPSVREAEDLNLCEHCPSRLKGETFCGGLKPVLPFLNEVDTYMSYDKVTAVLKTTDPSFLSIVDTDMQNALKYVSILGLMYYCKTNSRYWKNFFGVNPLENAKQIISQVYLNFFWLNAGDEDKIREDIKAFRSEITSSTQCLVKRLRIICKNDVFLNAFVNAQVITELLL